MANMRIHKAIEFATLKHQGQTRKGTDIPYIVHPIEVMQILTASGCEEDIIIAGILHDTLEDTNTEREEIVEAFGARVAELVAHESEDKSVSKPPSIGCASALMPWRYARSLTNSLIYAVSTTITKR